MLSADDHWTSAIAGRVEMMLFVKGFAIVCQALLAMLPQLWPVTWVMVPILLARWCVSVLPTHKLGTRLLFVPTMHALCSLCIT